MKSSKLNHFTMVEQLFNDGELDNAYQILIESIPFNELNLQQQQHYQFIQGLILFYQNRTKELGNLGEKMYNDGQLLNNNLQSFDGLFFILIAKITDLILEDAVFERFKEADKLLKMITVSRKEDFPIRECRLNLLKALAYLMSGNLDLADPSLKLVLQLKNELRNTFEIVWVHVLMARRMLQGEMQYDHALKYAKKALNLAKNIKFNHFWIAICYVGIGAVNYALGEFDISLRYAMKALMMYKKINNKWFYAVSLNNIGNIYAEMGEYNMALKYLEESLLLWEQGLANIEPCLDSLISVALKKGNYELAQNYFRKLEKLYQQKDNPHLELIYKYNKALMLKYSARIRDKAKAETLLKEVIETKLFAFDLKIDAIVHLCDLYLTEYRLSQDQEVFDELNLYITKLLLFANESHSFSVFCETVILQAKLSLLRFEIKAARQFLTQAQKTAETYGMKRLAIKISNLHDELLKRAHQWEKLKLTEASLSERIELAGIIEQMEKMVKKQNVEPPKFIEEEPVFLLIISEGGVPIVSHSFIQDRSFEDHLFGGFLTTINSFITKSFSEGLDRASFGEYTLILRSLVPFFICYIYKGQSYLAQHRINTFIKAVKNNEGIWEKIENFYQSNREIQTKEIPSLNILIKEIFIDKTKPLL
jgi:tetratricopeptide (TPR) repeat protein